MPISAETDSFQEGIHIARPVRELLMDAQDLIGRQGWGKKWLFRGVAKVAAGPSRARVKARDPNRPACGSLDTDELLDRGGFTSAVVTNEATDDPTRNGERNAAKKMPPGPQTRLDGLMKIANLYLVGHGSNLAMPPSRTQHRPGRVGGGEQYPFSMS